MSWESLIAALSWLAVLAGASASLAGFLGRAGWILDLFSHFRLQYLLYLSFLVPLLLLLRQPNPAAMALLFALLNLILILPLYAPLPTPVRAGASTSRCRLLLANVLQPNQQYERLGRLITAEEPDIIVLVEINPDWIAALTPALEPYPHRLLASRSDHYGLGIFSKLPILEGQTLQLDGLPIPTLAARLALDGGSFTLLAAHPPPPKGAELSRQRNVQFQALAGFLAARSGPAALAGDLNTSSWSPHFQNLIRQSGLDDSRRGFGLQPSWPTGLPLLLTPIDHILVSPEFKILKRRTGPEIGSDHFPVLLDFILQAAPAPEER
jgi:endonuclease/exonuclease/phosphatase (EEP) superfamily protein YafD